MPTTTTKQYIIKQLQNSTGDMLIMHPETDAAIVLVEQGTGHYEGQAQNVQAALEELFNIAQSGGVTGVKGNEETTYRQGNVNLTPANIGAVAANSAITGATKTKITYDSKGLVTGGDDATLDDIADGTTRKLADYILKTAGVTNVGYDTTAYKIQQTINGTTYDVVTVATLKTDMGLNNVTNNAQVKGLASGTTAGNLVVWGADGYTVADGGATSQFATSAQGALADTALQPGDISFGSYDSTKDYSVATLGTDGKVPSAQLPSYVDDVVETYIVSGSTPLSAGWLSETPSGSALTPETGVIYVVLSAGEYVNKTYRWGGSTYIEISESLVIGTTAGTAYDGASGQANADAIDVLEGYFTNGVANNAAQLDGHGASYFAIAADVTTLQGYFTNGIANQAAADGSGNNIVSTYQTKTLASPITIDGTPYTNIVDILTALNTLAASAKSTAANAQPKTLETPISVDGTSQTTVEGALGAINTLAAANKTAIGQNTTDIGTNATNIGTLQGYFTNGVANEAAELETARTIASSGDVVWSVSFDGSADVTAAAALSATGVSAGTYSAVTVDTKGRVTAGGQMIEVGTQGNNTPDANLAVGGLFFELI